jgi:hypothetical protein
LDKVYVIVGRHSDGSGYYVLRVLRSKARAERDASMLRAVAMMSIDICETEFDATPSEDSASG